ncbi:hypothetical protein CARUB_v10003252mg, partial [Capsella rubella]
ASSDKPLFLCPFPQILKGDSDSLMSPVNSSPKYVISTTSCTGKWYEDHSVFVLFWCNNREFDINGGCDICGYSKFDCLLAQSLNSYLITSHPDDHPINTEHSLQVSIFVDGFDNTECINFERKTLNLVYYCTKCKAIMHTVCVMKPIPFLVEQPKTHDHPLTIFPRQASLTCNFEECYCGVCRQSIDCEYGAYTCDKCGEYAVHSKCALGKHVWDGRDLEGVLEKDYTTNDVESFERTSEGVILHFLHDHHLQLQGSILYDDNKICEACVLPIFKGSYYSCMKCAFVLHDICAKAHRIIQHIDSGYSQGYFYCRFEVCGRNLKDTQSNVLYWCSDCCTSYHIECLLGEDPYVKPGQFFEANGTEIQILSKSYGCRPLCGICKNPCQGKI